MKKRLLSAALAVCMLFGSAAALPEGFLGESTVITASAAMNTSFYQLSDGTYRLKTCTGTDTSVTLPTEYNGKAVTDVGGVKSGGLDSGISVFSRLGAPNTTLTQLVVPSSYKKLSASAFADCTALKSVTLSTGLVQIGENVFGSDTALTSITIPSTVTSIASNAFNGCTALNSITVASGSTAFASVDGVLYNAAKTSLIAVPAAKTSIDIPGTVKTIPGAVLGTKITSVTLNEGTTKLEKWAFINCKDMKSITIPASVTTIENYAVGYYHATGDNLDPDTKIEGFTIYGYTGSEAEAYAKKSMNSHIKFVSIGTACTHTWGTTPSWTWSGVSSAKATFTCTKCSSKQEEDAAITSAVTKAATCSEKGVKTYTAKVTFGGKSYTSTKTADIAIDSTAHSWNTTASWNWNDYSSATAKVTCKLNSSHTKSASANITSKVTKEATCAATGERTYTATATIDGKTYTDTKKETIPIDSASHVWSTTASWSWSGYSSATAAITCSKCASKKTATATITNAVTKAATCAATGTRTYTAKATIDGKTYTDTKTETIPVDSDAHVWNTTVPKWTWSSDYKTATVALSCKNDASHMISAKATINSHVNHAPNCRTTGTTTHTATATLNGKTYTKTEIQETAIDPNSHSWGTTAAWMWSSDYKTATASLSCTRYSSHKLSVSASEITTVVNTAATCVAAGKSTHTATATLNGRTYTNKATEITPVDANAHKWGTTPSWTWSSDYKSATLLFTCESNASHTMSVPAAVTIKTTAQTCTAAGKTVYTASVKYGGKTYTDTREVSDAALGHDYVISVTKPSCTTQGYTTHTCTRCSSSYVDEYKSALGHNWVTWTTTTEPTCMADGEKESICTRCSVKTTRKIDQLGHDYVVSVVEPTCTKAGYTLHKCSRCKDFYKTDEKAALGHNCVTWVRTLEPTCKADGEEESICTRCSVKTTRKIAKLDHNYVVSVVAPTCQKEGYTLHKCSRCNDSYKTNETPKTDHNYKETVFEPTCTEQGYTLFTCADCGTSYKDKYTSKTNHNWSEWTQDKAPTCTAAGTKTRKCNICGEIQSGAVEALGHDHKAVVSDPTCTAQGFTMFTCTRCGDFYKSDYTDALGHDYGAWNITVDPTCTEAGEQSRTCQRCKNVEFAPAAALGHKYTVTTVMPTCTQQGYTRHSCIRCTESYDDTYTDELGHNWVTWKTKIAPTCMADGEEESSCTRCSVKTTRKVEMLGHAYKKTVIVPTCTEKGYTLNECSRCNDFFISNTKAALGHSWSAWTKVTAATCTAEGTEKHVCTRTGCTASETRPIAKLEHNYKKTVVEPTCTEMGYTTYTCSKCKDSYVDDYTNALGHYFGAWKTTKKATCTTDGLKKRTCTRTGCTESETQVIAKLGHDIVDTVVEPTCTEQGYTRHQCSRCTENYTDTYTEAKGHEFSKWTTITPATYTQEGKQQRKCKNCTAVEEKVIPKLGHNYKQTVTPPTCTQRGYTTFVCTDCGDTYEGNYVEALGHSFKANKVIAPTCTEKGYTIEKCERCSATRNENYTNELGHSFGEWQETTPASCTTNGVKTRKCTRTGCKASETDVIVSEGHKYTKKVIAPTCTENGCTEYTCSVCNHSYQDTITAALGHNFGSWVTVKAATCLEEGSKKQTCRRKGCGCVQTETIPKVEHDYQKTVFAPTCTEEGYTLYTCSMCNDSYKGNRKAAAGHKFGDWSEKVAATCENEGTESRTCSVCKAVETQATAKLGHQYTSVVKAATCTEMGHTTYTCTRCSASYDDNYTKALGHKWGSWKTTLAATCEAGGTQTRKCTRCTQTQTSTTAALGHDFVETRTVSPTCTEKGYSVYTCSRCSSSHNDDYVDSPGHKFGKWTTVEATVTKEGSNTRKCSVCGKKETTVLPKPSIRVYGKSRYETSLQIADRIKKENGGKALKCVIIASGTDYADALSASYLSSVKGNAPILITAKQLNQSVADYIRKNAASTATIYIVGGTGAVTADMEKKLVGFNVKRLAGKNRYATNLEVLKEAKVSGGEILIASGLGYADALSASAVGKPILLVAGKSLTQDQKDYLQKTARCTSATVIGGVGAVKAELEKQLKTIIKTVSRLGGNNRYETSVMVARKYFSKPATISLAYALNYPDGLCGGPLAMTYNCPLILTTDKTTQQAQKYASEIKATNTVTFGGASLISDKSLDTILGK